MLDNTGSIPNKHIFIHSILISLLLLLSSSSSASYSSFYDMKSFGHCNLAGVTDLQEGRSVWANWDLHLTVAPGCVQTGLCPLAGEAIDGIDCLVTVLTDEITDPATDDLISPGCRLAPDSEIFELVLPQLSPQLDPRTHEASG